MRERGWATNENQPPVGGYVTYVGDRSLHEHWKRANFVPGWKFPSCQHTHTHTQAYEYIHTHIYTKERKIPLYGYISMRRRDRVFLAAWVAFLLTICIYWEAGRRGGEGRGRAKTSKDPSRAILNGNFLFATTDVEAGCSRPDARRSIF